MKTILIICIGIITVAQAQVKKTTTKKTADKMVFTPPKVISTTVLKNATDSFSYAIGLEGASYYQSQGVAAVNPELIKKAFQDVYGKKTLLLTPEQSTMTIQNKLMAYMSNKNSAVKEEGRKFLEQNKKRA